MAILSNINGKFAVDSSGGIQFSGQTGTAGYVLKSNGNAAPTWVAPSTVIGGPYLPLSGGTLTGATATATGISFTVGGVLTTQGPDGGLVLRSWTGGATYGMLGTANMSGSEYSLLTDGTDTFLSGGANGSVYIRSGNNTSTHQLVISSTSAAFAGTISLPGTAAQYVTGTGALATFPAIPQGDITGLTAGTGITIAAATGPVPTITNSAPNIVQTSVTGNAGTATALQTARTINAVSFDGTANIMVPSIYDGNYRRITNPGGAEYVTTTSSVTGTIEIILPTGAGGMFSFTIEVYEYITNRSFTLKVGGHLSGVSWYNQFAYLVGDPGTNLDYTIRFGRNAAGKFVVYIGEITEVWSYPQVWVTDICWGFNLFSLTTTANWAINFRTGAFEGVTRTLSAVQVGYQATSNIANSVVLRDGSGGFSAGAISGTTFNGLAINTTGTNNVANQIVRTQGNGYTNFGWINTISGASSGTIARIYASQDAYIRYMTPTNFRTQITDPYYAPTGTVSGVTSVATGLGLTGGTITTTGTLSLDRADTQLGAVLATYGTTAGNSGRIRCTAPFNVNTGKMFSIEITIYSSYVQHNYVVSAYMYSTINQWYQPKAIYTTTGSATPDIYVGRDSNGKAYISIANGNYTGVVVHNMTRGYATSLNDTYDPWTITIDAGNENSVAVAVSQIWTTANLSAATLPGGPFLPLAGGTVTGLSNFTAGAKIVIQNGTDGGASRGIFMWSNTDANWGIYMSTPGSTQNIAGGAAPSGLNGESSHSIRFRIASSATNGFIWENSNNATLMSMNGNSGNLTTGASMRAPIFYDSNNTAYYGDFASNSVMNTVTFNGGSLNGTLTMGTQKALVANNYGRGVYGLYSSTKFQHVWSMGTAYNLADGGSNTGNLYGLCWSYPSAGGAAANLNTHGLMVINNGGWDASLASSTRAGSDMRAPIFYDLNDTSYYTDPAGTSKISKIWCTGSSTSTPRWDTSFYVAQSQHYYGQTGTQTMYIGENNTINIRSTGIASGSLRAPIFYDSTNTTYYTRPATSSNINSLYTAGLVQVGSGGSGNLYIGNSGSTQKLRFHIASGATTYFDMDGGTIHWRQNNGVSTRYWFYMSTGNITVAGSLTQLSDARLKENVVEIGDCISKVKAMRGVYYNRTDINIDTKKVGVIAQEVEAVVPELISENEDGHKAVAYSELTAVLINAIKEQQVMIDDLKSRIEILENN